MYVKNHPLRIPPFTVQLKCCRGKKKFVKTLKNTIEIGPKEISNKSLQENKALALDNIKKAILNKEPKKIIVIPGRVINIVL